MGDLLTHRTPRAMDSWGCSEKLSVECRGPDTQLPCAVLLLLLLPLLLLQSCTAALCRCIAALLQTWVVLLKRCV